MAQSQQPVAPSHEERITNLETRMTRLEKTVLELIGHHNEHHPEKVVETFPLGSIGSAD